MLLLSVNPHLFSLNKLGALILADDRGCGALSSLKLLGTLHVARCTWHLTLGLGTWHLAFGSWHLALGTWHLALGTLHVAFGTWHLVFGHVELGTWQLAFATWHLALSHDDEYVKIMIYIFCKFLRSTQDELISLEGVANISQTALEWS